MTVIEYCIQSTLKPLICSRKNQHEKSVTLHRVSLAPDVN